MSFFEDMIATGMSTVGDLMGSGLQQYYNKKNSKTQYERELQLDSSRFQRAAADAEAAGLNRILALGNPGSAHAPNMPGAEAPRIGSNITNARIANAQIRQAAANTANLEADTTKKNEEAALVRSQRSVADAQAVNIGQDTVLKEIMGRLNEANIHLSEANTGKVAYEVQSLIASAYYSRQAGDVAKSDAAIRQLAARMADLIGPSVHTMTERAAPILNEITRMALDWLESVGKDKPGKKSSGARVPWWPGAPSNKATGEW